MTVAIKDQGTSSSTWRYPIADHLGSIAIITDASGTVAQRLSYDPWGRMRNAGGTDDATGALPDNALSRRQFTGHEHVPQVSLVNMNARIYDPEIGRFMSADPVVDAPFSVHGFNRYAYVHNNPLSLTDPSGLCSQTVAASPGCLGEGANHHSRQQQIPTVTTTATYHGRLYYSNDFPSARFSGLGSTFGSRHGGPPAMPASPDSANNSNGNPSGVPELKNLKRALECARAAGCFVAYLHPSALQAGINALLASSSESAVRYIRDSASDRQLTFVTLQGGPNRSTWGGYWELSEESEVGGVIMQELTQVITFSDGTVVVRTFYEFWRVPPGSTRVSPRDQAGDRFDDNFTEAARGNVLSIEVTASARFYEGQRIPPDARPGKVPGAGNLPATTVDPGFPSGKATNAVDRTWRPPV